jgi:hypothetical protein
MAGFGKAQKPDSQNQNLILQVFGPFASFQTSKLGFSFGNRVSEPSQNRLVSYRSANLKKISVLQGFSAFFRFFGSEWLIIHDHFYCSSNEVTTSKGIFVTNWKNKVNNIFFLRQSKFLKYKLFY